MVKQDVLCCNTLDFKMWLKDLLCGYNALNHLEIVLWTPVLESDQVKYIRPMPISLVHEAVSSCFIFLPNFTQGEGRDLYCNHQIRIEI